MMKKMIANGEAFILETVLAKEEKIQFLSDCKDMGYNITGIFVGTDNPFINIERVKCRVKQGSYNVPDDKVVDRYNKCMKNLKRFYALVDEMLIYDNSGNKPKLIAYKFGNEHCFVKEPPKWLQEYL
jgi:predicted ABC-type ATPase